MNKGEREKTERMLGFMGVVPSERFLTLSRDYSNLKEQFKILSNTKHKVVNENKNLKIEISRLNSCNEACEKEIEHLIGKINKMVASLPKNYR